MARNKFCFAIDRGGTFTDIYAKCPNGKIRVMKLLSSDPANYQDAPREGIRRILEQETGVAHPKAEVIDCSRIEWIRMGTTVATNALLERKGARTALLINNGFKDLLYIGNQSRPQIFDLAVTTPEMLYEEVVEVECRVVPAFKNKCKLNESKTWQSVTGITDEEMLIKQPLNEEKLKNDLKQLRAKGVESLAVVLMHSYTYINDELRVGELAESLGFPNVSLSHQVMPMVRIVNRGYTVSADAYLTPHIKSYLKDFASGFQDNLLGVKVLFMQSDGGLTPMNKFNGSRAVLSGPAGGVVGYSRTTSGYPAVIGFDMGGTSTDVSRYAGSYEHVFESTTAGITIQAPQLDINTVAAGGGSRLFFRSGLFVVGPESAGAHPGPVCYSKGGYLTITDANLLLGRIIPHYFPKIFGSDEKQPLNSEATRSAFHQLTKEINESLVAEGSKKPEMSDSEVALGFVRVANETMCRPIRALTQGKGYDTSRHVLACFGGAGGQHACAIARDLGISKVVIHKYAGILSAYGMACADVVHEAIEPAAVSYSRDNFDYLEKRISNLESECISKLKEEGFVESMIETEPFLHMRYQGTDGSLMCAPSKLSSSPTTTKFGDFLLSFENRYETEYGFTITGRDVIVDDIRVRGIGKTVLEQDNTPQPASSQPRVDKIVKTCFEGFGFVDTSVYLLSDLSPGHQIPGPCIIIDGLSTIVIEPGCTGSITPTADIEIEVSVSNVHQISTELDTIQLSIFSHRFMSIAEQMGRVLQRTAISTNIKERLDFSCALFGPDGGLVSNAPHIPVHLGAMQETVQYQIKQLGGSIKEGDVILSNHPKAGGSHLPDLTVITPVFYKHSKEPVFFVASRGHHADIGGITPGSMPPHSRSLSEEGASFMSFFLVREGKFRQDELTAELMKPGLIPGSCGTRNLKDNIADLKAQIAANQKGITLVEELIDYYSLDVVQAYMNHIQCNAELAVRDMLRDIASRLPPGSRTLQAEDYMDDGSVIKLSVAIDPVQGSAICDFTGTGYEVWGNCNAPRAITLSALIYCLRCMVGHDVPLNQGCLAPIKVIIPVGSMLDPSEEAAVVGGNVQTSQRIVDVVLKAFQACSASQGCMNNITFGQDYWGYYETVAGGSGAGPSWRGRSGVHTHMTNTRITDPEILERRYPVILSKFSLREGSGGIGSNPGGEGVVRNLLFRDNIHLSILTERRVFHPYGLNGGGPGEKGINRLIKSDGRIISLPSKTAVAVQPGDEFQLYTPGGGGWGDPGISGVGEKPSNFPPTSLHKGSYYQYKLAQESA